MIIIAGGILKMGVLKKGFGGQAGMLINIWLRESIL